jgi:hypothetical protein
MVRQSLCILFLGYSMVYYGFHYDYCFIHLDSLNTFGIWLHSCDCRVMVGPVYGVLVVVCDTQ